MERINDSLRKITPMLPPSEDLDTKSRMSNRREESKYLDDRQS